VLQGFENRLSEDTRRPAFMLACLPQHRAEPLQWSATSRGVNEIPFLAIDDIAGDRDEFSR
jgi:hypothetical protein